METISIGLTVYFEDGFWHGLFEQVYRESYQVCRVTFGQEPKDDEILEIYRLSLPNYLLVQRLQLINM